MKNLEELFAEIDKIKTHFHLKQKLSTCTEEEKSHICDYLLSRSDFVIEYRFNIFGCFRDFCELFPLEKKKILNFVFNNDETYNALTNRWLKEFVELFLKDSFEKDEIEKIIFDRVFHHDFDKIMTDALVFVQKNKLKSLFEIFVLKASEEGLKDTRAFLILEAALRYPSLFTSKEEYINFAKAYPEVGKYVLSFAAGQKLLDGNECKNTLEELDSLVSQNIKKAEREREKAERKQEKVEWKTTIQNQPIYSSNLPQNINSLHKIAMKGSTQEKDYQDAVVELKNGIDLHQRDSLQRTPLSIATFNGHINLMLIFLAWGAKTSIKDSTNYLPKFFKAFYTCDHEYDEGGCIPLKRFMNKPQRKLLRELEELEKKHLIRQPYFLFTEIQEKVFLLLDEKDFANAKVRATICGYIINNLHEKERPYAFNSLTNYLFSKYEQKLDSESFYGSLREEYFIDEPSGPVLS